MLSTCGEVICFLPKARSLLVSSSACPAAFCIVSRRSRRGSPSFSDIIPSWTFPDMTVRILLKSCAIPPARRPMASIFWACSSCRSSCLRSVMSEKVPTPPVGCPSSSRRGITVRLIQVIVPSGKRIPVTASLTGTFSRIARIHADSSNCIEMPSSLSISQSGLKYLISSVSARFSLSICSAARLALMNPPSAATHTTPSTMVSNRVRRLLSLILSASSVFFRSVISRAKMRSAGRSMNVIVPALTSTCRSEPSLCLTIVSYIDGNSSPAIRRLYLSTRSSAYSGCR